MMIALLCKIYTATAQENASKARRRRDCISTLDAHASRSTPRNVTGRQTPPTRVCHHPDIASQQLFPQAVTMKYPDTHNTSDPTEEPTMVHFDWDIGPKQYRWDRTGNGGVMVSKNDMTDWLTQFEDICTRHGMTTEERHMIWEAMAHVCYQQMYEKRGAFYEALQPLFEGKGADTQTDPSVSG